MSGSLREFSPHGRGLTMSYRAGRLELEDGPPRQILLDWWSFPEQAGVLAGDQGIDVAIAGIGGGKTKIAAAKLLMWALGLPRNEHGVPTQGLVLGRDFKLVRTVQLEAVLDQARNLRRLAPGNPVELLREVKAIDAKLHTKPKPRGAEREALLRRRGEILIPVPYESIVQRVVSGQDPRIQFWNGVTLRGFSGTDPDRARGPGFDFSWIDEAEWQPEAALSMALNRQRSAEAVRVIVTSSPDVSGWLWQVISGENPTWDQLRVHNSVRVHRWRSQDNPTNDPKVLASIRAGIDAIKPGMSKQELDGLFVGTSEAPLDGPFDWSKAFCGGVALSPREARASVLGVDLGQKTDFTWLTVLSEAGVVLAMVRLNESTVEVSADAFYPYVEQRILDLIEKWRIPLVKIDTAMTGASQAQFLAQRLNGRARVVGYKTDQQTKRDEAIEALGVAVGRGSVRVPSAWTGPDGQVHVVEHVEQLRLEFVKLITDVQGRRRHFRHPAGGHDDGIVSLALAFQGIANRSPEVDLSPWLKKNKFRVPGSRWATPFGPGFRPGGPFSPFGRY